MRSPRYLPILLLIFSAAITSCNKTSENTPADIKTDSGEAYFQKGLEAKEPSKMLSIFKDGLDSAKIENDTIEFYLLDGIIHSYNRLKEYDSSMVYSEMMIQRAKTNQNTYFEALGYYRKGNSYRFQNNSENAFKNYYNSREKFLSIGDSLRAGQRSLEMANAQARMADNLGSQESATTALKLLPKKEDSSFISSAYNVIAISYANRNFQEDAIREYKNGLRFSNSMKDSLSYLNNIALVYVEQENFQKALNIFENVMTKADQVDEESRARFIDNHAYTSWLLDPEKDILEDLELALQIRLQLKDLDGLTSSYNHLSNYYEKNKPAKALDYAIKWRETAQDNASPNSELNALKRIIKLSSAENAKQYTDRFMSLNDSLQQANLKAKNTFAKIKFDEEQKQSEIDTLEAETAQQKIEAKELQDQIIIVSLGGLLLMVSSGFGFYYFRQKHKREKLQEVYKTEARISKKIHDELANDVYNVMSGMQEIAPNNIMDKLDHIYKRTRNISRENSSIPMGISYLPHLIATLSSSVSENTRLILRGEDSINWNKLSTEKKIILYRVLQEMMINMNKHSQASLVAIIFSEENDLLNIQYSDNGVGVSEESLESGNGIQNMENRIFSIKGKLKFETEPGKGVKIIIQINI
ncbi:ATP-binding protein [Christiangramia sp.]|uniref:ATP-binding protein n=1 Tax=Christiangramia sp. TaxID=1931228 RepID=UPI0026393495|nr:ATP-binding protein [Christiangramia sp.]